MLSVGALSMLVGTIALLLYLLYRASIPTPIPGIPYSSSALRPFGEAFAAAEYTARNDAITAFMIDKCHELQSPIFQIFIQPFKRPLVVVADSSTTEEILTRRTKEFDISPWFASLFQATNPAAHVYLPTNEQWRARRRLVNDLMSGQFLHNVAGPRAYAACYEMMDVWMEKVRLGGSRPFSASHDIEYTLLDNIWATAFGSSIGSTRVQKTFLSSLTDLPESSAGSRESVVIFPEASPPAACDALVTVSDSHRIAIQSPVGTLHHKLALRLYRKLRNAMSHKEAIITEQLTTAQKNVESKSPVDVASGADLLVQRERILADKEGRQPAYNTPAIRDELFTFLQAGNDTTSTALQWALKYLTANQKAQTNLRSAMRQEFGSNNVPPAIEITRARIAYLEAVIEETLRCGAPIGLVARETRTDCAILGCHVPPKTNVVLLTCGPGYCEPAVGSQRSLPTGVDPQHDNEPKNPFKADWDPDSLSDFQPERWLYVDENR